MYLEEKDGILKYVSDSNETEENRRFITKMSYYTIKRQGARVCFFNKVGHRLVLSFNPFDNTIFIHEKNGARLAAEFGAKRFLVGGAWEKTSDEEAKAIQAIQFPRDLSFPLHLKEEEKICPYKVVSLPELLSLYKGKEETLYEKLAKLFNDCADFTPGKQQEYLSGGEAVDKFCRFNLENLKVFGQTVIEHVFLLAGDRIIGVISANIMVDNKKIGVYVYDETVDYRILLTSEEQDFLDKLYKNEKNLTDEEQKKEIATIIAPKRRQLMRSLFSVAGREIIRRASELKEGSRPCEVYAFVRAAAGREEDYRALGCGQEKRAIFVVHGPPKTPAVLLDQHVKDWARQQLQLNQSHADDKRAVPFSKTTGFSYRKAIGYGLVFITLGVGLYKLRNTGSSDIPKPTTPSRRP